MMMLIRRIRLIIMMALIVIVLLLLVILIIMLVLDCLLVNDMIFIFGWKFGFLMHFPGLLTTLVNFGFLWPCFKV